MKHSLLLIFCIYSGLLGSEVYNVNKAGRMVQLDGFLFEWNRDSAKTFPNSYWKWDAINTREGLTGYFKTFKQPQCDCFTFVFMPGRQVIKFSSLQDLRQSLCRVIKSDSDSSTTMEWLIPWDNIVTDSSQSYRISLTIVDTCGDTLKPVIFQGHKFFVSQKRSCKGIYLAGGIIAILFMLFILFRKYKKPG